MHFCHFVSLGKGRGPSFEQTCLPFTQGCFVPSLVEIGPELLEKKMKMWKVYDNDGQQTNFWSEKLTWAFGSGELKKSESSCRNYQIRLRSPSSSVFLHHISCCMPTSLILEWNSSTRQLNLQLCWQNWWQPPLWNYLNVICC